MFSILPSCFFNIVLLYLLSLIPRIIQIGHNHIFWQSTDKQRRIACGLQLRCQTSNLWYKHREQCVFFDTCIVAVLYTLITFTMRKHFTLFIVFVTSLLGSMQSTFATESSLFTKAEQEFITTTTKSIEKENDLKNLETMYSSLYTKYLQSKSRSRDTIYNWLLMQIKGKFDASIKTTVWNYIFYRVNRYSAFLDMATDTKWLYTANMFDGIAYFPKNNLYMVVYSYSGMETSDLSLMYKGKKYTQIRELQTFIEDNYKWEKKYAIFDVPYNAPQIWELYVWDTKLIKLSSLKTRNDVMWPMGDVFRVIYNNSVCQAVKWFTMSFEDCQYLWNEDVYEWMSTLLILFASLRTPYLYDDYKTTIKTSDLWNQYCKEWDDWRKCYWDTDWKVTNIVEYNW